MGLKLTKIDAYILKDLIPMAIIANIFIVVILQSSTIVEVAPTLLVYNVPPLLSLRIILDTVPPILGLSLPLSVLVATIVVFSRMSSDNETVSMLSLGVGKGQLMRPVLVLAAAGMALTTFSTFYLAPLGGKDIYAVAQYSINNNIFKDVQPKTTYNHLPGLQFYVDDVDDGGRFRNIRIGVKGQPLAISSQRADFEFNKGLLVFVLEEGDMVWYGDADAGNADADADADAGNSGGIGSLSYIAFDEMVYTQRVLQPDTVLGGESVGYLSTGELVKRWRATGNVEAKLELSRRTASTFAVLIMAILGMAYGVFHARSSKMRLMIYAAGVILTYYALQTVGTGLALWMQSIEMQSIEMQSIEMQSIEMQSIEMQSIEMQSINGQAINGQAINGQAINGQAINGQAINNNAGGGMLLTHTVAPIVFPWLANIVLGVFAVVKVRRMMS